MNTPKFICLTNIPTPYRVFLFERLHQQLEGLGWRFEVWFMARSESGRHWSFDSSDFQFPHQFLRGRQFPIGSATLHWNPGISEALRHRRPDILLIAGAWIQPTVLLAALSSVPGRTIFWSESHLQSIRRRSLIVSLARRWVLSRFSEFAVPGEFAREYVERHSVAARIHLLPNVVDPSVFRDRCAAHASSSPGQYENRRVLLIVARLSKEKGLFPFLEGIEKLPSVDQKKLTVLIAGSGDLQGSIERWISEHKLDVRLLGEQTQSLLVQSYAQVDGFCLPSISDPNPLSVIEACWAGLPLLLSSRVGNHPECLQSGRNGFLFDPTRAESIAASVSQWLALSRAELTNFGETSLEIARNRFDPDTVVYTFLGELLEARITGHKRQSERAAAATR